MEQTQDAQGFFPPGRSLDAMRAALEQQVEALRRSEAKYRTLVEQIPACTYTAPPGATAVYISPQIEQIVGITAQEWLARKTAWVDSLHPDDRDRVLACEEEILQTGRGLDLQYRMRHRDGSYRWVRDIARMITDGAGQPLLQGVLTDITETRNLEEERDRLVESLSHRADQLRRLADELTRVEELQRRHLAHILHEDLQQILFGVKIQLNVQEEDAAVKNLAARLRRAGEMLDVALRLCRSLTSELSPPILYDSSLGVALQWLQKWVREKHSLEVELDLEEDVPLPEDLRVLLFRAVQELLFNTAKHSGVASAGVRLACRGRQVEVTVRDGGRGFTSACDQRGGEGFGLFSIRERLALAGGSMEIQSSQGCGTTVTLRLPLGEGRGAAGRQVGLS